MTFKIGDKVKVGDVYFKLMEADKAEMPILVGIPGQIIGESDSYLVVVFENNIEWAPNLNQWLFLESELEPLEEAHPLQNEVANS